MSIQYQLSESLLHPRSNLPALSSQSCDFVTVENLCSVITAKGDCFVASHNFVLGSFLQMTLKLRH
jgi:hypothetical protein